MTSRRSGWAVLAAVLAIVAAACGSTVSNAARRTASAGSGGNELATGDTVASGGDAGTSGDVTGGSGGGSGGGARAAAGGHQTTSASGAKSSATGTSSTTGPIEVGIVRTGVSNASAFGVSLGNTVSETDIYDAVIGAMNDQGGVGGHKIVPVYADSDTGSASWDADFQAACAKFTQDHHVVAVLGYVFGHFDNFEQCLTQKKVPHLSTTFAVPDAKIMSQYPLLFGLATPLIERRSIAKVDGALATGVVTKASKLGIVIDGCPGTERAWNDITKPYVLSKGLTIASTFTVGCAHGAGDVGYEASRAPGLVLQFKTAGVDTVFVNGVSEGPPVLVISNAAEAQNWHPKYVVSTGAGLSTLGGQMPAAQAANVHGFGWVPVLDVTPDRWPAMPPASKRCTALAAAKGVKLSAATDYAFAFNICEALFVYDAALRATGGKTDGPLVGRAIEALGSSFVGPLNLDGRDTYGPNRHDAPSLARYLAWDGGCSCFTYRPQTVVIR